MNEITLEEVVEQYYDEARSIHEIAENKDTYPNKIRRILMRGGYTLRSKSEAQSVAIASERAIHPTKGKTLSDETKVKISDKISESWGRLTKKELQVRKQLAREQWDKKSEVEKEDMRRKAHAAIRLTAKDGSRLEKALRARLLEQGYGVQFHHKGLIANDKLEVDIYLPGLKLAIEVDGPSHFLPVWGADALRRQKRSDQVKYGLLSSSGIDVLRVKILRRNITQKVERTFLEEVLAFVNEEELEHVGQLYELEIK